MAGIIVGVILLTPSLFRRKGQHGPGAALDITAPITGAPGQRRPLRLFTGRQHIGTPRTRTRIPRTPMLQRMVEAKAIFQENRQLKATLQLREREHSTVAIGRIVGSSFNSPRRFAILSAGSTDGVRIGMPVRSAEGSWGGSSTLAPSPRECCRLRPSQHRAGSPSSEAIPVISQGRGDGTIDDGPLEVGRNPSKRGDIIITSGTGGLYPPLVPIARVVKLDDDGAIAFLSPILDTSFAMVQPAFELAAVAAESTLTAESP